MRIFKLSPLAKIAIFLLEKPFPSLYKAGRIPLSQAYIRCHPELCVKMTRQRVDKEIEQRV